MQEQIKINTLEIENTKRIKAVKLEPTQNGLTIIGGENGQGKTSVLDAIAWALGGDRYKPSQANRTGSMTPPNLRVELSNGIIVERKGKNSDLKVTDPNGLKSGQRLLDSFIEELALNLPKFINSSDKEKAEILLQIIGVKEQLLQLELEYKRYYQERLTTGQIKEQKQKYANELNYYDNVPDGLISITDLIQQQQNILLKNAENEKKRNQLNHYIEQKKIEERKLTQLQEEIKKQNEIIYKLMENIEIAQINTQDLKDENTEELEENIKNIELINEKVRKNLEKEKAQTEANNLKEQYDKLSDKLYDIKKQKQLLLQNADLPLEELSVDDGVLTYKGQKWDNMSNSEQLKVATAIIRKLKPQCGFILIDQLEQMDLTTLREFNEWVTNEGLQVIATRVSTGDECSIIISDGYSEEVSTNNHDTNIKNFDNLF